MAKISVFGLGYVGAVSVAVLADNNHEVIGVDINPIKVEMINTGQSPIIENGLPELIAKGVAAGRIRATTDTAEAVLESEISILCVGTPSHNNGSLDLTYVERVCQQIGNSLANKSDYHIVIARSTMLPGSTENLVIPTLEEYSGLKAGLDFGVCFNPEFLREGSSIKDFYDPPFTVIGGEDERALEVVCDLFSMLDAETIITSTKVAEMVKYASNAFHALKVTFGNEVGNICKEQNIDSHKVMDIFCRDTKLNISSYYFKPGFAFGGSCLPKDLKAILYHARHFDLTVPVLEAILPSNLRQIERAYQMVRQTNSKRIGILGFSFKAGTDDLRDSPMVELVERLIGKGYQLAVYDSNVSLANLQGANKVYIEQEIPHIASLMKDSIEDVLATCDVIIIGNADPEFRTVIANTRPDQTIIDLVRIVDEHDGNKGHYEGISW
jgi:GDP-mannose 6-dehydrogenase